MKIERWIQAVQFLVGIAMVNLPAFNPPAVWSASQEESVDRQEVSSDYQKAKDYFYKKDYSKAKKLFEQVVDRDPDHAAANRYLGQIYREYYRDFTRAIRYLEKAVSLSSGSYKRDPLYQLAQAYEAAGQSQKALSAWEDYLSYCDRGSKWETEARRHIEDLKAKLQKPK